MYYIKKKCSACSQSVTGMSPSQSVGLDLPIGFCLFNSPASPETERHWFPAVWKNRHTVDYVTWGMVLKTEALPSPYVLTTSLCSFACSTTSDLTHSQGILGFHWQYRELRSSRHLGPCDKEKGTFNITMRSPAPPPPSPYLHSHFLFVYNIAKPPPTSLAHLRPDVFTLFPFFIMCRNRTNLATKSFVSRTKCFWCSIHVRSGYSPPPPTPHPFWHIVICFAEKGGFRWRKSRCTFLGTSILQGLEGLPYMT